MSSGSCPTVRVVSKDAPGGYVVINESDLSNEHELWEEPKAEAPPPAAPPPPPAPPPPAPPKGGKA
jgi:hypothetical protein